MIHALALLLALAPGLRQPDPPPRLAASPAENITVDGVLDEADWAGAEVATDFVQFEPTEGAPASQTTRVRVLVAGDALYVGAEMLDTDPGRIRQTLSRRDDSGNADSFVAAIDSYNDKRTARLFGVTAAGVQFDALLEGDDDDDSWDAVWTSSVRVTPQGWIAELRIPLSQLRFSGDERSWGVNFQRQIPRLGEESFWAPFSREQAGSGIVQFFGQLDGIGAASPRRLMQAVPYTLAGGSRFENTDAPGTASYGEELDVGADFKMGITPGVILDATINPDFGQVEADPAELNLSTFETFFEERRPFFLEGTQIFNNGFSRDGSLVYTRRIGADSPIIAASKLTGRTAGGLSFGALGAATGADFNPGQLFGVGRIRQESGEQNYIGATVTGFDGTGAAGCENSCARSVVGAADWRYLVGSNEQFEFEGVLAGSLRDVGEETDRGFALYAGFDQIKGYRTFGSGLRIYSPGFRNNDVGRFRQTDLMQVNGGGSIVWNDDQPFGPFRRARTFTFANTAWTYSDQTYRGFEVNSWTRGELTGFQEVGLRIGLSGLGNDVRETRGLGPIQNQFGFQIGGSVSTDQRRTFVAEIEGGIRAESDGGFGFGPELDIDWTVNDRVQLSASVEGEFGRGFRAWATNEGFVRDADGRLFVGRESDEPGALGADDLVDLGLADADADALLLGVTAWNDAVILPGGNGYYLPLFGTRDVNSAEASLRANVIVNPRLSLQMFGQLFAARGRYRDFSLLAAPDDLRPLAAYPKRRDFSSSSFLTNTVLRWEYRPGSTLFVVWQHSAGDSLFEEVLVSDAPDSPFDRGTFGQLDDLFGTFADDVVLVKLSYLLAR